MLPRARLSSPLALSAPPPSVLSCRFGRGGGELCKSSLRDSGATRTPSPCGPESSRPPPRLARLRRTPVAALLPGGRGGRRAGWRRGAPDAPRSTSQGATGASSGPSARRRRKERSKALQSGPHRRPDGLAGRPTGWSCLPPSPRHRLSRRAAPATLSATLSPYAAGAPHLSASSQPLKIAHDVTPRPSHWLASPSRGRARPSPWRPRPGRVCPGPAEAHGMR